MDTNDRFLRKITVGQGPNEKGHTREVNNDHVTIVKKHFQNKFSMNKKSCNIAFSKTFSLSENR